MPKTKEQIKAYNKEYFARPEVIARAKVRNAKPEHRKRRMEYKKTERGKKAERRYAIGFKKNHPLKFRERNLRLLYGLTLSEFNAMLAAQNNLCLICEKPPKTILTPLQVDHCHKTGKVRGLLCGSCNRALGLLKDDVKSLSNAMNYLNAFSTHEGNREDSRDEETLEGNSGRIERGQDDSHSADSD